jgi:hypothetical protein
MANHISVSPFGKIEPVREDLLAADLMERYWKWSEEQVSSYM